MVCVRQFFSDGITGTPGANTVATAAIQTGAITAAKLATGAVDTTALDRDNRETFLQIASLTGKDRLNMEDGVVDSYADETDIDTATSTGETFSTGKYTTKSIGTAVVTSATGSQGGGGASGSQLTGQSFQVATTNPITKFSYDLHGTLDGVGMTATLREYNSNVITGATVLATQTHTSTADTSNYLTYDFVAPFFTPATSTDYWLCLERTDGASTAVNKIGTGGTYADGHSWQNNAAQASADINFQIWQSPLTQASATTLQSNAFTAAAVPATARLYLHIKENVSITINTDLIAYASRDGGSNWTTATLVLINTLADGTTKVYEDASIDISGQPSGTAMKYKLAMANTKDIEFLGTVLQWST